MKRYLFLLILIFSFSLISAAPEIFLPSEVQAGETLIGNITGNFVQTIHSDLLLVYEGQKEVSLDKEVVYSNGIYYFYLSPQKSGNYTLRINSLIYRDPEIKSITLEKYFIVNEKPVLQGNQSYSQILAVPGFIFTSSSKDITLSNKGNLSLNVSVIFEGKETPLYIPARDFYRMPINPTQGFSILTIKSYKQFDIPVIFTPLKNQTTENSSLNQNNNSLALVPSFLKINLQANTTFNSSFMLINLGQLVENLSVNENSQFISIKPYNFSQKENENQIIQLDFFLNISGLYNESIRINYNQLGQQKQIILPIEISSFVNYSSSVEETKSCSELGGQLCSYSQKCNGEEYYASNGYCCVGECYSVEDISENFSISGWLIGIIIVVVLLIAGYFIYKKYKNTKPSKPEDALKKKTELYQNRISGSLTRN